MSFITLDVQGYLMSFDLPELETFQSLSEPQQEAFMGTLAALSLPELGVPAVPEPSMAFFVLAAWIAFALRVAK